MPLGWGRWKGTGSCRGAIRTPGRGAGEPSEIKGVKTKTQQARGWPQKLRGASSHVVSLGSLLPNWAPKFLSAQSSPKQKGTFLILTTCHLTAEAIKIKVSIPF